MVVPCLWHHQIANSDLGSHLYNAWLAKLVEHHQVSGMWVARQWTNVLFDLLLGAVGTFTSLLTAERIVVSLAVLIFFWGTFALVSAASRRPPWFIVPLIAMVTYGWTFQMGFFNYYLSLGLSFFGIAIFWHGRGWERLLALALVPLIALAHPLGLVWLVAASAYVVIAENLTGRWQWLLFFAGAALVIGGRYFIVHHYYVRDSMGSILRFNGADQLSLFGHRYTAIKYAALALAAVSLAIDAYRRYRQRLSWSAFIIPLQLYLIIELAVGMLPSGMLISRDLAAVALLTERLTSVSAVLACCLLGAMLPRRWHLAATGALAAVFFAFLYYDTGVLNHMEQQTEQLERTLPRNSRVMGTIFPLQGSRVLIQHMIDRACIGYCFSYGNYEPGTGLFRVRAVHGSPYNLGNYDLSVDMEAGEYIVQPQDLPVYQIYQCTESGTVLCIRPLQAGEQNNRLGVYRGE